MSVAQAEFVAYKAEAADRMKKMEGVIEGTIDDIKRLQEATSLISVQAAPWSVSIESAVVASEAKAEAALTEVRALFEGTKIEVEELRRRATEGEKKNSEKHWGLTRAKDLVPDVFSGKEDGWAKFKDNLIDYAESCHDGLKTQLEFVLKQKQEITQSVLGENPFGCTEKHWILRSEAYKLLKLKTELNSEARKIVECIGDSNGYEDFHCWLNLPICRISGARTHPRPQ